MMFNERIKQLREEQGLSLRKLAAALDIDTASYCKIEKGDRRTRKEYISVITDFLKADYEELLKFWLVDQVAADEEKLSNEVLKITRENLRSK
jgi:transcriptional regulator with XRE-family HTH domain